MLEHVHAIILFELDIQNFMIQLMFICIFNLLKHLILTYMQICIASRDHNSPHSIPFVAKLLAKRRRDI